MCQVWVAPVTVTALCVTADRPTRRFSHLRLQAMTIHHHTPFLEYLFCKGHCSRYCMEGDSREIKGTVVAHKQPVI